jgi:glycosyltransferase involved in cell wall biosynthesis
VPDPATGRTKICLNMIVRNEAHIVRETLDSVASYICSWVIVDTGSDDGTQELIVNHMAALGISGELHQRPWRDFGHNRTEALTLAQRHGDYIWVIDADDLLVGVPDFGQLDSDVYIMRMGQGSFLYWRPQLFRDGIRVRWVGVVHEVPEWDHSCSVERLPGDYHIESRRLGARSKDLQKYERDRDLLLAEVERNPDSARSVFYLAQTYFDLGDFVSARRWYARRVELGGWDQEVFYAMYRFAESMAALEEPWPDVQEAYLRAWEFRPIRAEPLYAVARRCRIDARYRLGYMFARYAAAVPLPEEDLFVDAEVYRWRAVDELAVCAGWIGENAEAFMLNRSLLARNDIPDDDRQRISANRDFSAPAMIEAALPYPDAIARSLVAGTRDAEVTVSCVAGPDRQVIERTLNSFLHCCKDVAKVGRFVLLDTALSAEDRVTVSQRYRFVEFADCVPEQGVSGQLALLREQIEGRYWLHLSRGWHFFAPEQFITRLTAVLAAETQVFQVGVNLNDATGLSGASASESAVRRTPDAGRYVLTGSVANGPGMFDTARLDRVGGISSTAADPITDLERRAAVAGLHTASLDEILCITDDRREFGDASHSRER